MSRRQSQEGLEMAAFGPGHDMPIPVENGAPVSGHDTPIPVENGAPVFESHQSTSGNIIPTSTTVDIEQERPWLRRKWIIIAAVVAVLVVAAIIGGAVGGVFGSKHKNNHASPTNSSTPQANSTNGGNLLPTSSQPRACKGGTCPILLQTITMSNKQYIFGLSSSKSLLYKSGDGQTWDATWQDLGGTFIYAPTIVSWGEGRIDAMGVETDKSVYWMSFSNNSWSPTWTALDGIILNSAPSAASWGSGRIDLFGTG